MWIIPALFLKDVQLSSPPPSRPKTKSKRICLKIISKKTYTAVYLLFLLRLPQSTLDMCYLCSVSFQQWLCGVFSGCGYTFIETLWALVQSVYPIHTILQENFKYSGGGLCCSLKLGVKGTVRAGALLGTWSKCVSKLRSSHQSLCRAVLVLALKRCLNSCFKTQEAKGQPALLPCSWWLLPRAWLSGHNMNGNRPLLTPLSINNQNKTQRVLHFFFLSRSMRCISPFTCDQ